MSNYSIKINWLIDGKILDKAVNINRTYQK